MNLKLSFTGLMLLLAACLLAQKSHITVNVSGFSSSKGKVMVGLYNQKGEFLKKTYLGANSKIKNKQAKVTFKNVPNGVYAISLFHDENNNNQLDSNFFGIPKEDYACSNNAQSMFGPPKWNDAKFKLDENKILKIKI